MAGLRASMGRAHFVLRERRGRSACFLGARRWPSPGGQGRRRRRVRPLMPVPCLQPSYSLLTTRSRSPPFSTRWLSFLRPCWGVHPCSRRLLLAASSGLVGATLRERSRIRTTMRLASPSCMLRRREGYHRLGTALRRTVPTAMLSSSRPAVGLCPTPHRLQQPPIRMDLLLGGSLQLRTLLKARWPWPCGPKHLWRHELSQGPTGLLGRVRSAGRRPLASGTFSCARAAATIEPRCSHSSLAKLDKS